MQPLRIALSLRSFIFVVCLSLSACTATSAQPPVLLGVPPADEEPRENLAGPPTLGYYREPTIHGETVVFCAEGDLWRVSIEGGMASRITTAPGEESHPAISPDGRWLAFTAEYEGPTEIYFMPLTGGLPQRLTYDARPSATVVGWKNNLIIASTDRFSTLPSWQLTLIDPQTRKRELLPLAQAADGSFSDDGDTLFFTRWQFQGSHSKRYQGGTAQNIWRFSPRADGQNDALPMTADYPGTSASPMTWNGRIYFDSDRDGTMQIWSMLPDGGDVQQHTRHETLDVKSPALQDGRIVFQLGADIHIYDIALNQSRMIDITLSSDFDQTRENWITRPQSWISSSHISPDGQRVALTARGRVFVAPRTQGRLAEVSHLPNLAPDAAPAARHRAARFMPDGKTIISLSDEVADGLRDAERIGEVELWTLPANGVGERTQLTNDGDCLRWEAMASPDGKWIAHHDKNLRLWLFNVETRQQKQIDELTTDSMFEGLAWSPDSRWLAYAWGAENLNRRIRVHGVDDGQMIDITTDRADSSSPAWSPDGQWLYFLSERHLQSRVNSPWGRMQPEPFFDRKTKVYHLPLKKGLRSPFAPLTELHADDDKPKENEKDKDKDDQKNGKDASPASPDAPPVADEAAKKDDIKRVEIDAAGIESRLIEVPLPPGNYAQLSVVGKRLLWIARGSEEGERPALMAANIARKDVKPEVIVRDISSYEASLDGKSLLLRRESGGGSLFIIGADAKPGASLDDAAVNLAGWTFSLTPREEWRQMFIESWRLERDYFYDRNMLNVDWKAMLARYLPLVDRVSTRNELNDLISQMVGELSTLHTFVRGGDARSADNAAQPASLGAILDRDEQAGGFVVQHIFQHDPDRPELAAPLAQHDVNMQAGDVILAINGRDALTVPDASLLLRNQAGRQVLLRVSTAAGEQRDVIVTPFTVAAEANLRYHQWAYTRRTIVETESDNDIGYVHLRAMGGGDFADFAREFYPVFNRKGLIIDVRHNRGGNIDSWIISRLLRRAWFYWQPRIGQPEWNMQFAFRGHLVVLCNERTASDGEAFAEGVKRLNLGRVIGTRTWGGEVWLSSSNFLVDRGIATAAETGVYGPDGIWLIEGHGVDPDQVVDNLPHATFNGEDAQLKAAIAYLKRKIEEEPVDVPPAPPYPNLRWPR